MILELMLKSKNDFREVWYCENNGETFSISRNKAMDWCVEDDITNEVLRDGLDTFYDAIDFVDNISK